MKKFIAIIVFTFAVSHCYATDSTSLEIHFDFNKASLNFLSKKSINSFFNTIDTTQFIIKKVSIFGHTDQIGSYHYNEILSTKRANETENYLKDSFGLRINLIENIKGFGKRQLKTNSYSQLNRALNRRVEIVIYFEKTKVLTLSIDTPITVSQSIAISPKISYKKLSEKIKDTALQVGSIVELPYLLFVGGLHEFLKISYPYFDELYFVMKNNPTLEIEIQGHICCVEGTGDGIDYGTGQKNLSYARAKAVYDFLRISGIDANRMSYKGFGHQFPITSEITEAEKTRNRRVEIKILKK